MRANPPRRRIGGAAGLKAAAASAANIPAPIKLAPDHFVAVPVHLAVGIVNFTIVLFSFYPFIFFEMALGFFFEAHRDHLLIPSALSCYLKNLAIPAMTVK